MVSASGVGDDGRSLQVTATALSGIDQTPPITAQASKSGTAETILAGSIETTAERSIILSAFGLGDAVTWAPVAGQTAIGYAVSGGSAGGTAYRVVPASGYDLGWMGDAAARPTLLMAAYAAAMTTGSAAGELVESYVYVPYGEGTETAGGGGTPFRYAGHRYDPETGLIYMRARYYSVTLGFGGRNTDLHEKLVRIAELLCRIASSPSR